MPTYREQVLADGAVAYWRLDESSGNALSQVGNFPGTVTGGVTRSQPGALSDGNTAMAFDGSSSYVSVPSLTLQFPDNCSVEAWVRLTSPPNPQEIVGFWKPGTSGLRLRCDGRLQCYLEVAGTGFFIVGATTGRFDNVWHHVVFVRSGGTTGTIYVDGVVDGTATAAAGVLTVSPAPIVIGARPDSPTQWFAKGTLDEVAIYPTALTPQQIANHYALRYGQRTYQELVIGDGAVAYWKLDESSGTVAKSQVGSYDGTISGGVTLGQPGAIQGYTAMAFDGVDDKISVANGAYSAWGTGPATVECWFKVATGQTYPSLQHLIDTKNQYNNNAGILIILDSFGIRIRVANGTASTIASGAFVPDGQWHHLTVRVTRGATDVLELYVDGIQRATQNFAATGWNITSIYPLTIATDSSDTSGTATHFAGVVDEVAIYQTALTPQQITAHYQARTAWPDTPYAPSVPADVYPAGSLSNRWLPLTPSDVIDAPFGKLWIGGAGNLAAVGADGRVVTFTGVKAGTMLLLAGRRINATNTTASAILALRTT